MNGNTSAEKPRLVDFARDKYSQFGEDGIIEKILGVIGARSRVCVEFGAWDGFHLSNTANLWTQGWKGILIEGDRLRFRALERNARPYDCVCLSAWVRREGPTRLESLLEGIATDVDVLSIDIDGDDYYVLESLQRLRPRVIICEYNPTIPPDLDLRAEYGSYFGSSVTALSRLAQEKGYELVALTQTNCFFVLAEEARRLDAFETRLERIRCDDQLVYLITSYSGDYVTSRPMPYGLSFPYRGALIGPHHRVTARCPVLRSWSAAVARAKRIAKRCLGRA